MPQPRPLTPGQLELVLHLANGKRVEEIALTVHKSISTVNKTITNARKRVGARTQAHLVSIAISTGSLVWSEEHEERCIPEYIAASEENLL